VFLQDVTGFMVGRDSEEEGIIRRGAKLVNAVSNSVVPKLTVIIGGSFGAGHYALAGKAYGPRFMFALPSARYGVMGGAQAAKTLLDVQLAQRRREGREPDDTELAQLAALVEADYDEALDVRYGAARLWVDEVVLPEELRPRLVRALEACAGEPDGGALRTGVIQT
jgi:3-methylcrotonyl-CoA carboxylase beta subunit